MPAQKEALRELSRAGEAYRFLLSERDLAVLVLSENVEDCNEAACQLFGVTRTEFIGRSPLEFAPPYQPDGMPSDTSARERLASALAGLPQWCTWQYRRKDGKPVDTIVHGETGYLAKVSQTIELYEEWAYEGMGFEADHKRKFDEPKVFAYRADIKDLAKYTKELLTNDKLREEMGRKAYEHAMKNFQYQDVAKKALKEIQEKLVK